MTASGENNVDRIISYVDTLGEVVNQVLILSCERLRKLRDRRTFDVKTIAEFQPFHDHYYFKATLFVRSNSFYVFKVALI